MTAADCLPAACHPAAALELVHRLRNPGIWCSCSPSFLDYSPRGTPIHCLQQRESQSVGNNLAVKANQRPLLPASKGPEAGA